MVSRRETQVKIFAKTHIEIARISNEGLLLIAILVAVLWSLIAANRLIVQRAEIVSSQTLRELRYLRLQNGARPGVSPGRRRMAQPATSSHALSSQI
jgi:hypothetical protein